MKQFQKHLTLKEILCVFLFWMESLRQKSQDPPFPNRGCAEPVLMTRDGHGHLLLDPRFRVVPLRVPGVSGP